MLLAQVQERVAGLRGRSAQEHRGKNTTVPVVISSAESAQVHRGKNTTVLAVTLECPTSVLAPVTLSRPPSVSPCCGSHRPASSGPAKYKDCGDPANKARVPTRARETILLGPSANTNNGTSANGSRLNPRPNAPSNTEGCSLGTSFQQAANTKAHRP